MTIARLCGSDQGEKIHTHLVGRFIEMVAKDGQWLMIYTNDGHRYRIGWQDDNGPIRGEPFIAAQDVIINIPSSALAGHTIAI